MSVKHLGGNVPILARFYLGEANGTFKIVGSENFGTV